MFEPSLLQFLSFFKIKPIISYLECVFQAITKKHTVPLVLVAVADVVVLVVKATVVVTVAVVREGMTVVESKVLKTSGEWKKNIK